MAFTRSFFVAALVALAATPAVAQFPEQQITMIVPFDAGGGSDRVARTVDQFWQEETGQGFGFRYQPVPPARSEPPPSLEPRRTDIPSES